MSTGVSSDASDRFCHSTFAFQWNNFSRPRLAETVPIRIWTWAPSEYDSGRIWAKKPSFGLISRGNSTRSQEEDQFVIGYRGSVGDESEMTPQGFLE